MGEVERAKRPVRLPVVLTREEVHALLRQLDGVTWLMASLLYSKPTSRSRYHRTIHSETGEAPGKR